MPRMAFRMRSSKFRHVFGKPEKKENCYEGVKVTKNAHDSNFCAVNPKFVAIVTESAGGGAFLVLPIERTGRVDINVAKVCGHSGPVLDIKWNPFNDHVIASCSDDATVKLWQVPECGLKTNLTEWIVDLHGHQRRVGFIEWHPTTENILLSAGYDFKCILWNAETAEPINIISVHTDTIFSISWNRDGSLFATTSKDKKIRIIDPRSGDVVEEGQGHQGSKASKVVFLGDKNKLFTTGFSRMSERQYAVWDTKNLSKPLRMETVDSSSGVLFPFYDHDTQVVFVAGKGDGNIRYYEVVEEAPHCHYLNQYSSPTPQRGLGYMPKRGIDPSRCEIVRFYKLHAIGKGVCEPVSMIVPRKSEMFQEDIFPPAPSICPSLTADEWISGQNRDPILISLKDGELMTRPKVTAAKAVQRKVTIRTEKREPRKNTENSRLPVVNVGRATGSPKISKAKQSTNTIRGKREASKKDGAISNSPTITTYRALKRGQSAVAPSTSTSESRLKRQQTVPPMATVAPQSPGKVPSSVKNIRKLSNLNIENVDDNCNANMDNDSVNDRINAFEKRTTISVKSTTRLTNANEPLQVDKKTWSSSYESNTNGMPRTDPEPSSDVMQVPSSSPLSTSPATPVRDSSYRGWSERSSAVGVNHQAGDNLVHLRRDHSEGHHTRSMTENTHSDGSENFSTPPTSPQSMSSVSSPVAPLDRTGRSGSQSSPMTWNENPIYADERRRPIYVEDSSLEKMLYGNAAMEDSEGTQGRHLRRSRGRNDRESGYSSRGPSVSEEQIHTSHRIYLRSSDSASTKSREDSRPSSIHISYQNGNRDTSPPSSHQEQEITSAYIDVNSFPTAAEAPDNTLIKPSKLRESMRRGKLKQPENKENNEPVTKSSDGGEGGSVFRKSSHDSTDINHNHPLMNSTATILARQPPKSRWSYASSTDSQLYVTLSPSTPVSPYITSPPIPPSDNVPRNEASPDEVATKDKYKSSRRYTPRKHRQVSNPELNQVHVKQVWSPRSPTSPEVLAENGMPSTDPELRKAYFRQVEEIKSLKEQISLKDKRIRQLEEEVRLLRTDDVGESNC